MRQASKIACTVMLLALATSISSQAVPAPGAISATVRVNSVNNIISTFVPILSYYMLDNKTMTLDFKESGFGYKIEIDSIHLNSVDGWTTKEVEFITAPTPNTVRLLFSGININALVSGSVTALWLIKLNMDQCNITNMTVQVDFALDSQDHLNWKVIESSVLSVGDVKVTTKSSWFNYLLNMMHKELMKIIRENLPKAEQTINAIFTNFNAEFAARTPTTFMVDLLKSNYTFLNMTTSTAPALDATTGLLSLNFDGLFYNTLKQSTFITKPNTVQPPRYEMSHSEQFWIHESMLNSLFLTFTEGKLPVDITNPNITKMLAMLIPELNTYFGKGVQLEIFAEIQSQDESAFHIDATKGLIVGDKDSVQFNLQVYATNATTTRTLAAEFQNFLQVVTNFTSSNFILYPVVNSFTVKNTQVVHNNCNLMDRNYDSLFTDLLDMAVNLFNSEFNAGYDLRNLNPNIGFIAGMFTNFTITPYQLDNFYYAGFSFFIDQPAQAYSLGEQKVMFPTF